MVGVVVGEAEAEDEDEAADEGQDEHATEDGEVGVEAPSEVGLGEEEDGDGDQEDGVEDAVEGVQGRLAGGRRPALHVEELVPGHPDLQHQHHVDDQEAEGEEHPEEADGGDGHRNLVSSRRRNW